MRALVGSELTETWHSSLSLLEPVAEGVGPMPAVQSGFTAELFGLSLVSIMTFLNSPGPAPSFYEGSKKLVYMCDAEGPQRQNQ